MQCIVEALFIIIVMPQPVSVSKLLKSDGVFLSWTIVSCQNYFCMWLLLFCYLLIYIVFLFLFLYLTVFLSA